MHWVVGLLAASILGAEGPRAVEAPQITYQLRILEMHGLDWRADSHGQLQQVARQGPVTVWTAPRDTAAKLTQKAGKIVAAPRVSALSRSAARISSNTTRNLVSGVSRAPAGPSSDASLAAFSPRIESAPEGWSAQVSGRKLDQGVLVNFNLATLQVIALHPIALNESFCTGRDPKDGKVDERAIHVSIQVPEMANAEVNGEWVIPNDGVLVVSLGAHTVADAKGMAVVRERLAVLEANAVEVEESGLSFAPARITLPLLKGFVMNPAAGVPMPVLAVPSRSLPLPLNAGGEHVPLPPLPDDHAPPPTSLEGSSEPCATPQLKGTPLGDPIPPKASEPRDPASKQAGYLDDPSCPADRPAAASGWSPSPARTFSFKLPNVEIEIRAVVTPKTSPSPSPSASVPAPPEIRPPSR